jgi:hypothetical protein
MEHVCPFRSCGRLSFYSIENLRRHQLRNHSSGANKKYRCDFCSKKFQRELHRHLHETNCPSNPVNLFQRPARDQSSVVRGAGVGARSGLRANVNGSRRLQANVLNTAFRGANTTFRVNFGRNSPTEHVNLITQGSLAFLDLLLKFLRKHLSAKIAISLHCVFHKVSDESILTVPPAVLSTEPFEIYASTDVQNILSVLAPEQIKSRIDSFVSTGSGWVVNHCICVDMNCWLLDPLRASAYIPLPSYIIKTKSTVNPRNTDNKCFQYAVLVCQN